MEVSIFSWLGSFFSDIFSWVLNICKFCLDSIRDWIWGIVSFYFDRMLAQVPDPASYLQSASTFCQYYSVVDSWTNLSAGLGLLSAWLTFTCIFILVKFILKLIPTIG